MRTQTTIRERVILRVQISARHCDVPQDVMERTEVQVASLSKYSPRATAADVVYMEEKLTKVAEVIIHIDGGEPVVARGQGAEFRSALDEVIDRLSRRLRRQRERRTNHKAPPLGEGVGG
jgi:ribosomal subunit interface protein